MRWLIYFALACGTPKEESAESAQTGPNPTAAVEVEALPVLTIAEPERGSFDTSGSGLVVGTVDLNGGTAEALTVNGASVGLNSGGDFSAQMSWTPGIQILSTRVETVEGERAVDGRAFHAGPVHDPGAWIPGSIRMEIDGEILDDDDPEPDDIAGLLELALEDRSLLDGLLGLPIDVGGAVFTPTALNYGRATIDVAPGDGELVGVVSLEGLETSFDVSGVDWYSWLSTSGSAWASSADIAIRMSVDSAAGVVRCEASEIEAAIDGFGVTVDYVPDFLEGSIAGFAESYISQAIEDVVREEVIPRAEEVLSGFAVGATFDQAALALEMRLAEVEVVPAGIRFEIDARVEATDGLPLPDHAGSLDTSGSPTEWPESKEQSLWAAVDDDLLNQLGFAFWQSGLASDIELDAVLLAAMSGGPLPPPLGPADTITMDLHLPPVLSPTEHDDWAAQLAIGEWNLAFNRTDGEVIDFSISLRAHVQAEVNGDGEISLSVDSRPAYIDQAVGVLDAPEALDPGDLSALVRLLIPPLLSNTASFAPDIPIPEFPLDQFLAVEATEGLSLRVDDPSVRLEDNGWLLLQAGLKVH